MLKTYCRTCAFAALALSIALTGYSQEKTPSPAANDKAAASAAADKTPAFPTNEQMRHYKGMSDPQLSPDGKLVLVRIADATADGAKGHIWLIDVGGGAARQLTFSPAGDKRGEQRAQWMPDGKSVLFLAHRGEHTQLYRLPMDGGEAKVLDLKVAPLADESKREGALPPAPAKKDDAKKDEEKVERWRLMWRAIACRRMGRRLRSLRMIRRRRGRRRRRTRRRMRSGSIMGCMGRGVPAGCGDGEADGDGRARDVRGAAWSADSSKLVAIAEGPEWGDELGPASSAWIVTVSDPAKAAKVDAIPATVGPAVWSHDGGNIIYLAQAKKDAPPGYSDMYTYDLASKTTTNLTDGFVGTVGHQEPIALLDGGVLQDTEEGVEARLRRYGADGKSSVVKLPVPLWRMPATNDAQSGWVFLGSSGGEAPKLMYSATLGETPKVLATPALARRM